MPVATPAAALGMPAPAFELPDVFGVRRNRADVLDGAANLVIFFCNHCPYAQAVEGRVLTLIRDLAPTGLKAVLIASNDWEAYPEDAPAALQARAIEQNYPCPYLVDEDQKVARAFDAACTPDCFLFDGEGKLVYRGRIDDNWKRPAQVTRHELREAIEAVIGHQPVDATQHPALGCSIKWRDG